MDKRIKWIDSLRGIGCSIVVLAHILASVPCIGSKVSGCGKIGVWLLFLLCGFFTLYPYIGREKQFEAVSFYVKRIFRIFPAYIVVLILCYSINYLSGKNIIKHILLLSGTGHFWTIPVEMKFYVLVPVIIFILSICKDKYKIYILIILGMLAAVLFPYTGYLENSVEITWYITVFLTGMLVAVLYTKINKEKCSMRYDLCIIGILIGMLFSVPWVRYKIFRIPVNGYLQNKYLYFSVAWAIIFLCIEKTVWIKKVLLHAHVLQWVGQISYSLYLIHYIILQIAGKYIINQYFKGIFVIVVSVFAAVLLEKFVERPMNNICKTKVLHSNLARSMFKRKRLNYIVIVVGLLFCFCIESRSASYEKVTQTISTNEVELSSNSVEESSTSWTDQLYVPTMIQKVDDTYFIIDCWNSRILYNTDLSADLTEWNTLTDENYLGGHTLASDGELYVFDNTDMQQVLVYQKNLQGDFELKQTISGIETRPHFVLYDQDSNKFYVIGSTNGTIYTFENQNGELVLTNKDVLPEVEGSYVRSISIIDGMLYTVSGPNAIYAYSMSETGFTLADTYYVPDDICGMNQITKIDDKYVITINTDVQGSTDATTIIETDDLSNLETGDYIDLYDEMGFVGQPYFITNFDGRYWICEISASQGNGIKSFMFDHGIVSDVESLFYWEDVSDASIQRWTDQTNQYGGQAVDLIIFMGQSNMSGKGDATEAPSVEYGYEFRAISDPSRLYSIAEPFGVYENNPNGVDDTTDTGEFRKLGGMVSAFANAYYDTTGVPIVGVSCSEGNTSIVEWSIGESFSNDAIARIEAAKNYLNSTSQYYLRNTYMVWCQGENDGDQGMSSDEYYNKLNDLVNYYVSNGYVDKTFVVRIGNKGDDSELYDEIIDAQTRLCHDSDNCILVSTQFARMAQDGLMKDVYHYTQEGYNIVGEESGENAGEYVLTGIEPDVFDYEYNQSYLSE